MFEYDCFDTRTGENLSLFGYSFSHALEKEGISAEYARNNIYCYSETYVD